MKKAIFLGVVGIAVGYMLYSVYTGTETKSQILLKLLATVLAGAYVGFLAVAYVLPLLSSKFVDLVFSDNADAPEPDELSKARGLVAQGEYQAAIEEYMNAIEKDPSNRLAWTDVAKIYADQLEQPEHAIETYRSAYESQDWSEDDAAFFLFRISECQQNIMHDNEAAVATLNEIIVTFPKTRHSANAMNQLRQIGLEPN